ncbi:MAG: hypothetical protein M1831_001074 [Alyxoria varia]|nr:MAG: hypothetical protein M1831_001074 [Alyxoria varia]
MLTLSNLEQGEVPTSLAEFTLDTGSGQTFYDISLVDGYNLPMAIVLRPLHNSSFEAIPPSLTSPSCIGSPGELAPSPFDPYSSGSFLGTNASDPLPFDTKVTTQQVSSWCPSNLEVHALPAPPSGVYTYPDGNVQRPSFDPCYSACARFSQPRDCCTGSFGSPSTCSPSAYSKAVKGVCPDAYSYAFDDQTSTFIVPAGAGFEVVFCPGGRSTNILATQKQKLIQLAQEGHVELKRQQPLDYEQNQEEDSEVVEKQRDHIRSKRQQKQYDEDPEVVENLVRDGASVKEQAEKSTSSYVAESPPPDLDLHPSMAVTESPPLPVDRGLTPPDSDILQHATDTAAASTSSSSSVDISTATSPPAHQYNQQHLVNPPLVSIVTAAQQATATVTVTPPPPNVITSVGAAGQTSTSTVTALPLDTWNQVARWGGARDMLRPGNGGAMVTVVREGPPVESSAAGDGGVRRMRERGMGVVRRLWPWVGLVGMGVVEVVG